MSIKPSLSKRLLVDILEDRTVPAISPFSDPHLNPDPHCRAQTVKQEFTSTEIMVQVQGTNGVQVLQQLLGQLGNRQVSFDCRIRARFSPTTIPASFTWELGRL